MCRILSWSGQTCADGSDLNYQSTNGLYGLASGGWFGVGLGQSRQKYSWIPEAHNDFIFAIIGEELGLVGTLVVLVLFAILGTAIYRVVVAQKDMFHRVLAGTIMVWLLGQATVNMAVVTGLAPVVGIPLPVHFLRRLGTAHVAVRDRRSLVTGPGPDGTRPAAEAAVQVRPGRTRGVPAEAERGARAAGNAAENAARTRPDQPARPPANRQPDNQAPAKAAADAPGPPRPAPRTPAPETRHQNSRPQQSRTKA